MYVIYILYTGGYIEFEMSKTERSRTKSTWNYSGDFVVETTTIVFRKVWCFPRGRNAGEKSALKGSGINRQTLSEKLPDCKIHSASAFETLTARKNASEWGRRERSRGGGRGVGSKKKLRGSTRTDRTNKQSNSKTKKKWGKRGNKTERKKRRTNVRQKKKDGKKKEKGGEHQRVKCLPLRRTNGYRALAAIFGTRISLVGDWKIGGRGAGMETNREDPQKIARRNGEG